MDEIRSAAGRYADRFMFPGAEMYELEKARLTFRLDPPPTEEKKPKTARLRNGTAPKLLSFISFSV